MKNKELAYFRSLLEREVRELEFKAVGTVSTAILVNHYTADPLDRAAIDTGISISMRIRDRESRLMKKIQESLDKIEDGTYGICEICEESISIARLKARPVARYCIKCKTKMEALKKAGGF